MVDVQKERYFTENTDTTLYNMNLMCYVQNKVKNKEGKKGF
jgi:hypothetical protein